MATQLRAESKSTVTQITTGCNQGLQKSIYKRTTCWSLTQMHHSSRRQHQLSPGNWGHSSQVSSKRVVWGIFSHFVLLSTKGALVKHNSQPEYCRWPRPTLLIKDSKRSVFRFTTSDPLRLVSWTWPFTVLRWPPQSPDLRTFGDVLEQQIHITVWYYHVVMNQNLRESMKREGQRWRETNPTQH